MQGVDAGGGCRGWMQDVDAGGGCRRWMQGVDAGGWMQGVYRWIPPGWLRAWGTVGGKIAPEAPRGIFGEMLGTTPEMLGSPGRNNQGGVAPLGPKIC